MNFTVIGPIYPYRGGISHFTTQLIQALAKTGHTVQPISFKRQYPNWLYPGKSDKDPSKYPIQIDAQYLLDPLNPFTWKSTADLIYRRKPDLVIIQWWTTFWAFAFACLCMRLKWKKIKVGYIVHNVLPHEQRFFDPWLAKLALSQGQFFLTQTEEEKLRLLQLIPGRNVNVGYMPTYSIISDRQLSREEARQIMGFPSKRSLILFFGIIRPYKGLKNLIESIAILNANHPDVRPYLLVAGEIWDDKKVYEEQIVRLDLAECVRLDDRYIPDEGLQ
jgi:glycosyltransferase involved in cell wall biosynthesis